MSELQDKLIDLRQEIAKLRREALDLERRIAKINRELASISDPERQISLMQWRGETEKELQVVQSDMKGAESDAALLSSVEKNAGRDGDLSGLAPQILRILDKIDIIADDIATIKSEQYTAKEERRRIRDDMRLAQLERQSLRDDFLVFRMPAQTNTWQRLLVVAGIVAMIAIIVFLVVVGAKMLL